MDVGTHHILDLNDDCLAKIFVLLPLQDFRQIRKVCQRFEDVVLSCCRAKFKKWQGVKMYGTLFDCCDYKTKVDTDFHWKVLHMRDVVLHMELPHLTTEEAVFLDSFVFSNTKSLKVSLCDDEDESPQMDRLNKVKMLTEIYPNITKLVFQGDLDQVSVVTNFPNLIELELYYPWSTLKAEEFVPIFTQLKLTNFSLYAHAGDSADSVESFFNAIIKCKTLEEVGLSLLFFNDFTKLLNEFPKLRKLNLIERLMHHVNQYNWRAVYEDFADRVLSFYSSFRFIFTNAEDMSDMKNLEKWCIDDQTVQLQHDDQCYFPNLRELHCLSRSTTFKKFDPETQRMVDISIVDVVAHYKKLEVLYVPCSWINEEFQLSELVNTLENQKERKTPLKLFYGRTKLEKQQSKIFSYNERPDLLLVSMAEDVKGVNHSENEHWDSVSRDYFKVFLKPLECA